jgi:hypothetical protein
MLGGGESDDVLDLLANTMTKMAAARSRVFSSLPWTAACTA